MLDFGLLLLDVGMHDARVDREVGVDANTQFLGTLEHIASGLRERTTLGDSDDEISNGNLFERRASASYNFNNSYVAGAGLFDNSASAPFTFRPTAPSAIACARARQGRTVAARPDGPHHGCEQRFCPCLGAEAGRVHLDCQKSGRQPRRPGQAVVRRLKKALRFAVSVVELADGVAKYRWPCPGADPQRLLAVSTSI